MTVKKPIGKILLRQRALRPDELDRALAERGEGRLASRLAKQGTITDAAALKALSEQHGVPGIDLSESCVELGALALLPREIATEYRVLPLRELEACVCVAMADPRDKARIDELGQGFGKRVHPFVALESALDVAIERAYEGKPISSSGCSETPLSPCVLPGLVLDDAMAEIATAEDVEEPNFEDVSHPPQMSDSAADPSETSRTILLAIADHDLRKLLVQLLSHSGRVIDADSGAVALDWLGQSNPDLVVIDARLPDRLGFEIARRIKRGECSRHVPIILIGAASGAWQSAERLKRTLPVEFVIEQPVRVAPIMSAAEAFLREPRHPKGSEAARAREVGLALRSGSEAYRRGDLEEALSHVRRGVALDPFGFGVHFQLGLLCAKSGQIFDAIGALEAAVATDGKHFSCLKSLAILHQKAGYRDLAVETWEHALKNAPDEAARQSIRERLLKLL